MPSRCEMTSRVRARGMSTVWALAWCAVLCPATALPAGPVGADTLEEVRAHVTACESLLKQSDTPTAEQVRALTERFTGPVSGRGDALGRSLDAGRRCLAALTVRVRSDVGGTLSAIDLLRRIDLLARQPADGFDLARLASTLLQTAEPGLDGPGLLDTLVQGLWIGCSLEQAVHGPTQWACHSYLQAHLTVPLVQSPALGPYALEAAKHLRGLLDVFAMPDGIKAPGERIDRMLELATRLRESGRDAPVVVATARARFFQARGEDAGEKACIDYVEAQRSLSRVPLDAISPQARVHLLTSLADVTQRYFSATADLHGTMADACPDRFRLIEQTWAQVATRLPLSETAATEASDAFYEAARQLGVKYIEGLILRGDIPRAQDVADDLAGARLPPHEIGWLAIALELAPLDGLGTLRAANQALQVARADGVSCGVGDRGARLRAAFQLMDRTLVKHGAGFHMPDWFTHCTRSTP